MSQNTSHAVMAQRREAKDSLDDFPTPTWATRALCEHLALIDPHLRSRVAWEPACNRGFMARGLADYFGTVLESDVADYGQPWAVLHDFLMPGPALFDRVDWVVTNPPFRLAQQFAKVAQLRAREGVALLVRTAFLEGAGRYRELFERNPPATILQFVERVPMVKGRCDPDASTATAYCWLVWRTCPRPPGQDFTPRFRWIPPCRRRLERPGDYDARGAQA